jgi:hypothetical protein
LFPSEVPVKDPDAFAQSLEIQFRRGGIDPPLSQAGPLSTVATSVTTREADTEQGEYQ